MLVGVSHVFVRRWDMTCMAQPSDRDYLGIKINTLPGRHAMWKRLGQALR